MRKTDELYLSRRPARGEDRAPRRPRRRSGAAARRRPKIVAALLAAMMIAGGALLWEGSFDSPQPEDIRGTPAWAIKYYGDPDAPRFASRNIVEIDFVGRAMFVHRAAKRHFLRLERLFEARAPDYAAAVTDGELDDWSYENRNVRSAGAKSMHAFGLAVDVNALANPLGVSGDMPDDVVTQWEAEGGEWGGDWTRPDPMHFESHLTPKEIRARYRNDGTPRSWYLEQLTGG